MDRPRLRAMFLCGSATRKIALCVLPAFLFLPVAAAAQAEFVGRDFFPAEFEFKELGQTRTDLSLDDGSAISTVERGELFVEAGCLRFQSRTFALVNGGSLSIEIATLKDGKGAYSLLTLLRPAPVHEGPPGQYLSEDSDELIFAQGNYWVRVRAEDLELTKRVATSVSNRIGVRESCLPPLVKRMPEAGFDPASLRYMLGPKSFQAFGKEGRGFRFQPAPDLEVAQAQYAEWGRTGELTLLGFATGQLAEDFFDSLPGPQIRKPAGGSSTFAKRVGPLVGILEGTFEPEEADKILGSLEFQYSIRWIFDKNNRSSATVWGVPVSLLGTVVRSLALTALLCVASLFAGFGIAVFRILLRGYAPNNILDRPERTEIIRLKLDEN